MRAARARPGGALACAALALASCAASGARGEPAGASRGAPGDAARAGRGGAPAPAPVAPAAEGERALAVRAAKVLTMDAQARVLDPGMVLVRDGRIEYVGPPVEPPAGFELVDCGPAWLSPGMVDLHSHIHGGGFGDINDMVLPTNPELSSRPVIVPSNHDIRRACAGGVTTLFGIPGSGTSMGGFGVLYKTKTDAGYEEIVVRDPGGLKVAQNYNPQRGGGDAGSTWCGLAWVLETLNDRAAAAARDGRVDPRLANLVRVHQGELPVLIHCASAEGVADTVRMWKLRYHTHCIVSHGSWDGWHVARFAAENGVPVNHGPRTMNFTAAVREDRIVGTASEYVAAGVPDFSLNTDASVIPQEELFLQGSMSARLGADPYQMLQAVTCNPARAFLVGDRVGSLEVGKDADLVVSSGDPLDPRSRVEMVLIDGEVQYSRTEDGQWF